jgi:hypothetical protein
MCSISRGWCCRAVVLRYVVYGVRDVYTGQWQRVATLRTRRFETSERRSGGDEVRWAGLPGLPALQTKTIPLYHHGAACR